MPSGKQSKRRRKVQAPPPPVAKRRQASPKVLIGAAAVAVLVVVAIILAVVLTGGGKSSGGSGDGAAKLPDASQVQQTFAGIPQSGLVLGKPTAPVTMIEYIDLQCPYCQQFETTAMPTVIDKLIRTGKLRVEARPIAILGPDSLRGQSAAVAASLQNKAFNFMQLLYDNQGTENTGWLDDAIVRSAGASISGFDASKLETDMDSKTVSQLVSEINTKAQSDGVNKTPTILVGKTGRKPTEVSLSSPSDSAAVEAAVTAATAG